jgi:RimJ/RimL family protein N-acetyltransferase
VTAPADLVELLEIDAALVASLRGEGGARLQVAPGFPRKEDVEALAKADRGAMGFLICADGVVVGTCGVHGPPNVEGVVELGWGLVDGERGRGIGSLAVAGLLDAVRTTFPDAPLVAHTEWSAADDGVAADSPASEAILARLGFRPEPAPTAAGYRAWWLAAD